MKTNITSMNRRQFLMAAVASSAALATTFPASGAAAGPVSLGIGTYGMKSLKTDEALKLIAKTGYDGVELALMEGWPTDPKVISAEQRKALRSRLGELGLALPSLLESLPLKGTAEARALNLERLKLGAALAHDLAISHPPVIETILGLKTSDWEKSKSQMVAELKDWAKTAESSDITICFKPHAAQAVHSPERALWLLNEVGSKRIRLIYDYSHMFVEGFPMEESMKQLLPHAVFIHVKDATGAPGKHEYLLPGDGKTDYVAYFKLLKQQGYHGFVIVEVSSMISRKPEYQPIPTAKLCYERMSKALAEAGLERPKRKA